jgi:hypothetical protein
MLGSCLPGCIDNSNCAEPQPECTDNHRCESATVLEFIEIYTESCVGCVGGNYEKGVTLRLHGKYPTTECATAYLDHADRVDYETGESSIFNKKEQLDSCYQVSELKLKHILFHSKIVSSLCCSIFFGKTLVATYTDLHMWNT